MTVFTSSKWCKMCGPIMCEVPSVLHLGFRRGITYLVLGDLSMSIRHTGEALPVHPAPQQRMRVIKVWTEVKW